MSCWTLGSRYNTGNQAGGNVASPNYLIDGDRLMLTDHPLYPVVLSYPTDTIGIAYTILADHPTITDAADLAHRVFLAEYRDRHGRCRGDKTFAIAYESYKRGPKSANSADSKSTAMLAEVRDILGDNLADAFLETGHIGRAAKLAGCHRDTVTNRMNKCRAKLAERFKVRFPHRDRIA